MDIATFVARALTIIYLSVGIGMLFNKNYYKKFFDNMYNEMTALYVGGFMATITGLAIISYHNIWTGWPILVTIVGWLALIKGVMILLLPNAFEGIVKNIIKNISVWSPLIIALGLVFGYFGFLA